MRRFHPFCGSLLLFDFNAPFRPSFQEGRREGEEEDGKDRNSYNACSIRGGHIVHLVVALAGNEVHTLLMQ